MLDPDVALDVDGPYCDEHLTDVRAWCAECLACTEERMQSRRDCPHKSGAPLDAPPDPDCYWCGSAEAEMRR